MPSRPRSTRAHARHARTRAVAPSAISILAALASALLAACGGSTPSTPANAAAGEAQNEAKMAAFARCLRAHGLQAATSPGPGGLGLKVSPGKAGPSPRTFEAAQTACARYRPAPKRIDLSPQQKVEQEEHVQRFARCMREHGIKVETSTSGGTIRIGIHRSANEGGPNPESPGFQAAQTACQKLLPFKGLGPGAGRLDKSTGAPHERRAAGKQGSGFALSAGS